MSSPLVDDEYERSWRDMLNHVLEVDKANKLTKAWRPSTIETPDRATIHLSGDIQLGLLRQWDRLTKLVQVDKEDLYEVLKRIMIELDRYHKRRSSEKKRLRRKLAEAYEPIDMRPRIPGIPRVE